MLCFYRNANTFVCLQAEQKMDTQNLARQKLNGNKVTTSEAYQDEHSAYLMTSPPTERELFIIRKPICAYMHVRTC